MQAFHNDAKIKEKYIERLKAHAQADRIVKGQYWENGKGCAVGCTIEGNDHSRYETELGIPMAIARLEDRIFEGMPNDEAKSFPIDFLQSINVGADLSLVLPKFFIWLLVDKEDGVIKFAGKNEKVFSAIRKVADLYQDVVDGKEVKKESWKAAASDADAAAYAAAASDADAAAYAYADAAAYAAAAAASVSCSSVRRSSAAYAADAAYAAAAAARQKFYSKMAKKLIEILKETK